MVVPKFYEFFEPVLECLSSGDVLKPKEIESRVVSSLGIPHELYEDVTPKSRRPRITDRVQWAITYLAQSELIERPERGKYRITDAGRRFLKEAMRPITKSSLETLPAFLDFQSRGGKSDASIQQQASLLGSDNTSPQEQIADAYKALQDLLISEVKSKLHDLRPDQFERLVLSLVHKMGYGIPDDLGSIQHTGKSGDGGIDGVIHLDKLGLDKICLQAKKFADNSISRKELQAFVGALSGVGATRGVFLTTSSFTREATEYVGQNKQYQISLIDGLALSRLLVEHGVGVITEETFVVKRLDADFFEAV